MMRSSKTRNTSRHKNHMTRPRRASRTRRFPSDKKGRVSEFSYRTSDTLRSDIGLIQVVGSLLLTFIVAFGVVAGHSMIGDLGYEMSQVKSELASAQSQTAVLQSEVARLKDPDRISTRALDLGLIPVARENVFLSREEIGDNEERSAAIVAGFGTPVEQKEGSLAASNLRVVVHLDPVDQHSGMQMADLRSLGDRVILWLRGNTPVEAHAPEGRR